MKLIYASYKTISIFGFLFLFVFCTPLYAQTEEPTPLKPNIISMKTIISEHYSKRQFSVLSDTLTQFSFPDKKWVIVNKVVIPQDAKVIIRPGVSLLFEPNATLRVEGALEAIGSKDNPIVFSKIDSTDMVKKPESNTFTWNGISLGKNGTLLLRNARIEYAQTGVTSDGMCDSIVLDSIDFSKTLPFMLTSSNYSVSVNKNKMFSLACKQSGANTLYPKPWLSGILYGTSIACIVTSGIFYSLAYSADKNAAQATDHFTAQKAADKATKLYTGSFLTGLSALCIATPTVIINIAHKKRKDK